MDQNIHTIRDRLRPGLLAFSVLLVISSSIANYLGNHFGGAWFWISILVFVWLTISIIVCVLLLAYCSVKRQMKNAASALCGLIVLLPLPGFGSPLRDIVSFSMDYGRLFINQDFYLREAARAPEPESGRRSASFDWGSSGFLSTNFFFTLVYDESGEILLQELQPTTSSKEGTSSYSTIGADRCKSRIVHLRGFFYSVRTLCQ